MFDNIFEKIKNDIVVYNTTIGIVVGIVIGTIIIILF